MELTKKELQELIYNPALLQKRQLDLLHKSVNGQFTISDPTNPFTMLLEATNATAASAILECNSVIRRKYPSLANTEDDLYHHLHNDQLSYVFATPAVVTLDFYVNLIDLKNEGFRPLNANFVQTTIPKWTKIEVLGIPLLLVNDIVVKLYDNNAIFAEQQINQSPVSFKDTGTLNTMLFHSPDETPWIWLRTKVKQLNRVVVSKPIVASEIFQQVAKIEDLYNFVEVGYKNNFTNGLIKPMEIAYNDSYLDPLKPTAFVTPYQKEILVRIPSMYILDNGVSGVVTTVAYETKGKMYLPINKYQTQDFNIKLGDTGTSKSAATIKNISLLCNSQGIIDGGTNSVTGLKLREIVINNLRDTILPVTTKQIENTAELKGYKVVLDKDVVTARSFIAMRSLPPVKGTLIQAKPDIIFGTCRVVIGELLGHSKVFVEKYNQETERGVFVITSNTVFKDNNGLVKILSDNEVDALNRLKPSELISRLNRSKYFYNPYYYVVDINEKYTNHRVYDLDNPTIDNIRINNKNLSVEHRVNVDKYDIQKIDTGYRVLMTIAPNAEFNLVDKDTIKLQMKIPLLGGKSYAYIDSIFNKERNWYEFYIETNFMVDSDDRLILTNGRSDMYTKKMDLKLNVSIYTLSSDDAVSPDKSFMEDEIEEQDRGVYIVFTREDIDLTLGYSLDRIYKRLYSYYSSKKYLTHQEDVPMVYPEDVYRIDPETGSPFHCRLDIPTQDPTHVEFEILHKAGDVMLDGETGEPILKYKKGDVVLDEKGEPVVDRMMGVIRNIEIMLLEYEFMLANTEAHNNYRRLVVEAINNYILQDMKELNSMLLENTIVSYRSFKSNRRVGILINGLPSSLNYLIKPTVTLYLVNVSELKETERDMYVTIIGNIINSHLDNSRIVINDIRKDIVKNIGSSVVGVNIEGIGKGNAEVIEIENENDKLTLDKNLVVDIAGNLVVRYNITLNIQYTKA